MSNKVNKIIYELPKYYSKDNFVFDNIYSHFFNVLYAGELYSSSTIVEITKKFRIDLAISENTNDFSIIKIINILNNKPYGIFSYNELDKVYVPSVNAAKYINTVNKQIHPQDEIYLNNDMKESLLKSYDNLQENLSKLDISQINKYIQNVDEIYLFVETDEYIVKNKYKGLIQ